MSPFAFTSEQVEPCWIEKKCEQLITQIKRSQYSKECFADARYFMEQGYVSDVALAIAWNYWK